MPERRVPLAPKAHRAVRDLWVLPGPMVQQVLREPTPPSPDRKVSRVRRVIRGLKARLDRRARTA